MKLERLKIVASNRFPWGKVTDLETGEEVPNISRLELVIDPNGMKPVVTLTFHLAEVIVETDETVIPEGRGTVRFSSRGSEANDD